MSKKRKKLLLKGRFYSSYPNGGHPSLIFRKNKRKNQFDAVVFGTTPGHHRTLLKHPISNSITKSVVHNRPIRGVRKDFGDKELTNLKVNKEDKPKIEVVKRKKPQETKKYKEKTLLINKKT